MRARVHSDPCSQAPPAKVNEGIGGVLGSCERLVHPVHTGLQTPDGAGMGETPETRGWRAWMEGWGSAPTRGNFLLKKEKLSRETHFLELLPSSPKWSFPFSGFAAMLGTSLDLSVPIGDAFGSAKIPGGIGGNCG